MDGDYMNQETFLKTLDSYRKAAGTILTRCPAIRNFSFRWMGESNLLALNSENESLIPELDSLSVSSHYTLVDFGKPILPPFNPGDFLRISGYLYEPYTIYTRAYGSVTQDEFGNVVEQTPPSEKQNKDVVSVYVEVKKFSLSELKNNSPKIKELFANAKPKVKAEAYRAIDMHLANILNWEKKLNDIRKALAQ